jgi:D-amino-acid oxidase
MWALSAPDGGAEGCFMRLEQTEYYAEPFTRPHPLNHMPDVRRFDFLSYRSRLICTDLV